MTIIIALLILTLVVLVHELGHFVAAKRIGIPIYELSLGFGYKLFSFKRNGIEYALRLFPIGASVRMAGEEPGDMDNRDGYNARTPLEKIRVAFAGPFMNFVLAVAIFIFSYAVVGIPQAVNEPVIGKIMPDTPADQAGLRENDRVISVNQVKVNSWTEFMNCIKQNPLGKDVSLVIQRNGDTRTIVVTPIKNANTGKPMIGVYSKIEYQRQGIIKATRMGFSQTYDMTAMLLQGMGMLFSGKASVSDLTGPVGITSMASDAAQGGYLLLFTAFLSIALGLFNLFPIQIGRAHV